MTDQIGQYDAKVMDLRITHKLTKFTPDLTDQVKLLYVACRFAVCEC